MSVPASCNEDGWRLPQLWAVFLLGLIAVSFRLWIPAAENALPPVPLISQVAHLPVAVTWCPIVLLVTSLIVVAVFPCRFRACWWIVSASLVFAFLLNQHRLQPWAYQSAIYALVFASMDASAARRCMVPFAISIYLFSGLGKLDYQFAHSVGQELIDVATRPIGGLPERFDESIRARLALTLPAAEGLIALCLIFRPLRRIAGVAVIAMHVSLIAMLGPWGLNHSFGVLTWNALLIVQSWFLFVKPGRAGMPEASILSRSPSGRVNVAAFPAYVAIALALVAPIFERSGYWDHWLSWALYSPHNSRVDVQIHQSAMASLDPSMQDFLEPDRDSDGWQTLSLGRWSLDRLGVPIYPQARYQLGLVVEVARRHRLDDAVRSRMRGVSNRWTGARTEHLLLGQVELENARKQFWLGR